MEWVKLLWARTKLVAETYTWTFIVVIALNQLLFFGFCLNPICLIAAMPHCLAITVILGTFLNKISGWGTKNKGPINLSTSVNESLKTVDHRHSQGNEDNTTISNKAFSTSTYTVEHETLEVEESKRLKSNDIKTKNNQSIKIYGESTTNIFETSEKFKQKIPASQKDIYTKIPIIAAGNFKIITSDKNYREIIREMAGKRKRNNMLIKGESLMTKRFRKNLVKKSVSGLKRLNP